MIPTVCSSLYSLDKKISVSAPTKIPNVKHADSKNKTA